MSHSLTINDVRHNRPTFIDLRKPTKRHAALRKMHDVRQVLQQRLLPPAAPQPPVIRAAGPYQPAVSSQHRQTELNALTDRLKSHRS